MCRSHCYPLPPFFFFNDLLLAQFLLLQLPYDLHARFYVFAMTTPVTVPCGRIAVWLSSFRSRDAPSLRNNYLILSKGKSWIIMQTYGYAQLTCISSKAP
ncbi:hypothetical protein C2G38_2053414 [Gigaspora rosea]|uniref:Uncharacterized protein n=1 Tax=Gigaspora rosea TaxID=44941 RepID=A0A397WDQ1_9GLOM|nr:hypothetical protein C2G38_2053414 [Gigaspora rosea]